jgi:hypothetical protein
VLECGCLDPVVVEPSSHLLHRACQIITNAADFYDIKHHDMTPFGSLLTESCRSRELELTQINAPVFSKFAGAGNTTP